MPQSYRYLSLAFVASDLLLEVDEQRQIRFAAGASANPGEDAAGAYRGRVLDDLLGRASAWEVRGQLASITPGQRVGPINVLGRCPDGSVRKGTLRGFCAPQLAPCVSLGVSWDGLPFSLETPAPLLSRDALLDRAKETLETPARAVSVAFVEVPGLSRPPASDVLDVVVAALQDASMDGQSAAQLSSERFAVLRSDEDSRDLAALLKAACGAEQVDIDPVVDQASVTSDADPKAALRALRFAIAECLSGGAESAGGAFSARLKQTLSDAAQFRQTAKEQAFHIHFQPIVDLVSGAIHHHEVLARFHAGDTGELIRMAEELDLIKAFDLAVLQKALRALRLPGAGLSKLAINLSGASLMTDEFVDTLLRRTSAEPDDRRRLMVEITETAAMADMPAARERLSRLRAVGVKVCIDDFGSGAASYEYLRALPVDVVKLDGRLTRSIVGDERSRTMVRHLVDLCRTLSVRTVAEQVETREVADALRNLGVDMAQGWCFGRATPELLNRIPEPGRAKRKGDVAAWG